MRRTGHDLLRIPAFRELPAGARGQHTAKSHHLRAVRVKWTQSSPDRLSTDRRKPVCPAKLSEGCRPAPDDGDEGPGNR